jgi:sugar lactone lactonase YvrE
MRHLARAFLLSVAMAAPAAALAATLHPGDVVLAWKPWQNYPALVVTLDAATLDTTVVSFGPYVSYPRGIVVDRTGRILVAEPDVGIVHVDAASQSQQILTAASALGGTPAGICLGPDGEMYVTVRGAAPGVVRVSSDGSSVTPVSSGDHITYPGNLARGPDGGLYVTENSVPDDNGGVLYGIRGHGSIVRVDPATGGQTVIAADSMFMGPFDIAFVSQDKVWTLQHGYVAGRRGCFVETFIGDGRSFMAPATSDCRSRGVAVAEDGTIYASDCHTIGPDCYTPYVTRLPAGPERDGMGGPMTVVPQNLVPIRQGSWGRLKTIYR